MEAHKGVCDASLKDNSLDSASSPSVDKALSCADDHASPTRRVSPLATLLDSIRHKASTTRSGPRKVSAAKSCSRAVSRKQAAAVRNYVREFEGPLDNQIMIHMNMYGQAGVGLDQVLGRINCDAFCEGYDPTQDIRYSMATSLEGKKILVQGWTWCPTLAWTPETWPRGCYSPYADGRHCEACTFVYDVTSRKSFDDMKTCYKNFCLERTMERPTGAACCRRFCPSRPPFPGAVFVIANKIDCEEAKWMVSLKEGERFCTSIGAIFMPMSAKTGEGGGPTTLSEIVSHILYRRAQYKPWLEGKPTIEDTGLDAATASCSGCGFFRRLPKAGPRTPLHDSMLLERERILDREGFTRTEDGFRKAKNPDWLYMY